MNRPAPLRALLDERLEALSSSHVELPGDEHAVGAVLISSNFVFEQLLKSPPWWQDLLNSGDLDRRVDPGHFARIKTGLLQQAQDRAGLMRLLRACKLREAIRIAWRDLAGRADLDETLRDLSLLAECLIQAALEWLSANLQARLGVPRTESGEALGLTVIGMGKLGAGELNFSSDVDLVFAYPEAGETDGKRRLSAEEYFPRLARELVQVLDENTEDGYVYRVDIRLRPHGAAGRLALSWPAMEEYFQREGRDWERYAWIKAQPVAGDLAFGETLIQRLKPFVYRRYLDWSALQALRELKAQVEREVQRKGLHDDIKLGAGGIREIEFIAQVFQLIRGGRDAALRDRRLETTLERLREREWISATVAAQLIQAYRFLRRLENRLQMLDDRQTHRLPTEKLPRLQIAFSMGHADWEAFKNELDRIRNTVHGHFQLVFAGERVESAGTASDWTDEGVSLEDLERIGFEKPEAARQRLTGFLGSAPVRAMGGRGRGRLDRVLPRILAALEESQSPDEALPRVLRVLEAVARRSVYLSMLLENPALTQRVCQLCGNSAWLADEIARAPLLLDELLKPATDIVQQDEAGLRAELGRALGVTRDLEQRVEALAEFKRGVTFQVALAELSRRCEPLQAGQCLSSLARVVLTAALQLAAQGREVPPLAIVAYGRLGAGELAYDSDLDLVFLYGQTADSAESARLARRLTHLLTTPTAAGRMYPVDTRLRPNGQAGLLVSSLDAYRKYQLTEAWTWEQQALVRARCAAGPHALSERFADVRRETLLRPRERHALREEVQAMRQRLREEHRSGADDLKQGEGGMVDVGFLAQYWVLAHAAQHPTLIENTGTVPILAALARLGLIPEESARALTAAYLALQGAQHRETLQSLPPVGELATHREAVQRIWTSQFN